MDRYFVCKPCGHTKIVSVVSSGPHYCPRCSTVVYKVLLQEIPKTQAYHFGFNLHNAPNYQAQSTGGAQVSVKILWDDSVAAYRVATPYSSNFVELLKQQIPIASRVWDPIAKIWTIEDQYGDPM